MKHQGDADLQITIDGSLIPALTEKCFLHLFYDLDIPCSCLLWSYLEGRQKHPVSSVFHASSG